jgi:predicted ATPase
MIKRIEAKNYRSLKYIDQKLENFHVLVGPNASGKTTFMDVVSFLADIVKSGIDGAIASRSANFNDLTFSMKGGDIELAIEVELPEKIKSQYQHGSFSVIRYELRIGLTIDTQEHAIKEERAILVNDESMMVKFDTPQRSLFPETTVEPASILNKKYRATFFKSVLRKKPGGNDNFYPETYKESGKGYIPSFKLGVKRSALGNLPADETKFPAATWLKEFLLDGVQLFILDSQNIKHASPPGQSKKFKTDGSNLPWVIHELRQSNEKQFGKWIKHIQTALPDLVDIETVEREDDKHRYLRVLYNNNIRVPSWLISDGTLRLFALTLPAYLPGFSGVYLIEEPENGIHPRAVETIIQSLSSVYNAQIMLATHSSVILSLLNPSEVLCFAKTSGGTTDIVKGSEHPKLKGWKGETNFSVLYASGILG